MILEVVARFTISLDSELAAEVQEAARAASSSTSAWLAEAARRQLAASTLPAIVAQWEAEHGAFSPDELATARRRLTGC